MKLAVVGSRTFCDELKLERVLESYRDRVTLLVSGGAKGADSLAESWAVRNGIPTRVFKPDWQKYGRAAGMIRNRDIIENCDECVAFWDGKSKGTQNSIFICEKLGKKTQIITYDN